jgi:tetratricopeptide (TPR) repeat protein
MSDVLTPEQLASQGKTAYQKKDYRQAAQSFELAAEGFKASGDLLNAAEMLNNQSVALLQEGDAQNALQVVEGTDKTFLAAGDVHRQAMALSNRGAALEGLGQLEAAMASYEQASELFKQIGEHELRAHIMHSLSILQLRTGKQLQGLATMDSGLEETEKPKPRQRLLKRLLDIPLKFFIRS